MKEVITVLFSAITFALLRAGTGYWIGTQIPDYYRSVFINGRDPDFDPVAVGIGQGLTQGVTAGVIVGLFVVALKGFTQRNRSKSGAPNA